MLMCVLPTRGASTQAAIANAPNPASVTASRVRIGLIGVTCSSA
jgi:hypothetical protein